MQAKQMNRNRKGQLHDIEAENFNVLKGCH